MSDLRLPRVAARPRLPSTLVGVLSLLSLGVSVGAEVSQWESEIKVFESSDRTNPPPAGGIVFVGSSSIRLWRSLAEDFKGLPVLNRGFGGSQLGDSVALANRVVLPYRPRQVVLYAGDNDLAAGRSPQQVEADFRAFVKAVHAALPEARIAFIAIKPSLIRWHLAEKIREANRLVFQATQVDRFLAFIDVFTPMLGPDGQPRAELFRDDHLHLNPQGYALWTRLIRPYLVLNKPAATGL